MLIVGLTKYSMSQKRIVKRQSRKVSGKLLYLSKNKGKGGKSVYETELQRRETKREEYLRTNARRWLWKKDLTLPLSTEERNNRQDILWESLVYTLVSDIFIQMLIYLSNFMSVSNSLGFSDEFMNAVCPAKCTSTTSLALKKTHRNCILFTFIAGKSITYRKSWDLNFCDNFLPVFQILKKHTVRCSISVIRDHGILCFCL